MSRFTETEEYILRSFYEGKSVTALIRDYAEIHRITKNKAQQIIYDCLYKGVIVF